MSDDAAEQQDSGMAQTQSKPSSPRKALAAAKTLRSTGAFGLTEHQLMLADLFKSPKATVPQGEPKNIEVLQNLAKPLARHRTEKFTVELEKAQAEASKAPKAHELGEPKNLEFLVNLSKPTPRLQAKKFEDEISELRAKPSGPRELPEPKNIERLMEMSKPLKKTKKFSDLLAEEEAAAAKRGHVKFDPTVKRAPKPKKSPPKPKKPAAAPPAAAAAPPAAAPKQEEEEKTADAQPAEPAAEEQPAAESAAPVDGAGDDGGGDAAPADAAPAEMA